MRIKALAVKDYGPFTKQTSFQFKPGVSVIYGLNQSTGKYSQNSNWVGKSLFFNSLSEILYDEPLVGLKADKVKKGTKAVILTDDKNTIQIVKSSNGKKETIKIIENGTPIEHLTKTKANDYIKSKWNVSRAEFESFIHLDSRVPHPLVMGSSTDRKHFFDDFFKLEAIDVERKLYLSALRKLESAKQAYKELKVVYKQQSKSVIEDSEYEDLIQELEHCKAKQKKLQSQFQEAQTFNSLKSVYDKVSPALKSLPCSIDEIDEKLESLKSNRKELRVIQEDINEYKAYLKQKQKYEDSYANLSELAKQTKPEKLKKGSEYYTANKSKLSLVTDELDELEEVEEVSEPSYEDYDLVSCLAERSKLEDSLRLSLKFKSGVCPTCNQPVKTTSIKDIKAQLVEVETKIKQAKQWDRYRKSKELYDKFVQTKSALLKSKSQYEGKVKKFKPYYDAYLEYQNLPKRPDVVDKPSLNPKQLQAKLDKLDSVQSKLSAVQPYVDTVQKYNEFNGCKTFDSDEFNKLNEHVARLEAKVELNKSARQSLQHTVDRLRELKTSLKDEQALKTLVELFSDKQIKKVLVSQVSEHLCALLNKYASLVFNEDYTFELIWESQLQLICTRKVGKQVLTSDVRKLSGAESKLVTIMLLISLLSFLPTEKRPQLLIMDEPTANLSAETTQAFMKLVDILKTVIPSIVIITPRDDVYPDSMPYTVLRTKAGSTIVEGFPYEINK